MGLQSQLSLSVEVTRALGPATLAQSGHTLVKWARAIQRNGSDILIEQDLGGLFSRFHIDPDFADEFKERALSLNNVKTISKYFPIALQAGPGATVQRALQDPAFMPMIIHLSMFGATHEVSSFAEAMSEVLRTRTEDDEKKEAPFFPPQTIKGTIQACVEQTSGFQWHLLVDRIVRTLRLPHYIRGQHRRNHLPLNEADHFYGLSVEQLGACMDILLALQRVYSDHVMVVNGSRGIVPIILWVHFVLGLTVMVKESPAGNVPFGENHAAVVIQYTGDSVSKRWPVEIYFMGPAPFNEVLLTIQDRGTSAVEPIGRRMGPIRGYAARTLGALTLFENGTQCLNEASQLELSQYAAALAILAGRHLADHTPKREKETIWNFLRKDPKSISGSCELILDDLYEPSQIELVTEQLQNTKVKDILPPPSLPQFKKPELRGGDWMRLLRATTDLAKVILTFAAVGDLRACQDLIVGEAHLIENEGSHIFHWNGRDRLSNDSAYSTVAGMLHNYSDVQDYKKSVLFSCHGWSVYRDILVQRDPAESVRSRIWIQSGVPSYEGARARRILDGPSNIELEAKRVEMIETPKDLRDVSQDVTSAYDVTLMRPSISMATEEWRVNQRFRQDRGERTSVSIGYGELERSVGSAIHVIECSHGKGTASPRMDKPTDIQLLPGVAVSKGFWFTELNSGPRICVAQTYGNYLARWLALAGRSVSNSHYTVVLRKESTCLDCFMDKACQINPGPDARFHGLYLVL